MKVWSVKFDGNSKQEVAKFSTGKFEFRAVNRVGDELFVTCIPIEKTLAERKISEWFANSHLTIEVS